MMAIGEQLSGIMFVFICGEEVSSLDDASLNQTDGAVSLTSWKVPGIDS